MHNPVPRNLMATTAFGASLPRTATIGNVILKEQPDIALASVATRANGQLPKSVQGVPLATVGQAEFKQNLASIWIGPSQWMIAAPYESHEHLYSAVKKSVKSAGSVTEQSDAWVLIDITGVELEQYFELLCAANIHTMTAGSASRVVIEHVTALLVCRAPGAHYWLLGARSSAESLWHRLEAAAYAIA